MRGFNFEHYNGLSDKEKGVFILEYRMRRFRDDFSWKGEINKEEFFKICASDRKVMKWLKKLNNDILLLTTAPSYTNIEDVPSEVRGLILIDKKKFENLERELSVDLKNMNEAWDKSEQNIIRKRNEGIKGLSYYFLVTTIEIKDIPLERKRKMITLESKGDEKSLELAGIERKGLVHEYKKELFSILIKNNGTFPEGFENSFVEKFLA